MVNDIFDNLVNNVYCLILTTIIAIFLLRYSNKIKKEKLRRLTKISIIYLWFPITIFSHPVIVLQVWSVLLIGFLNFVIPLIGGVFLIWVVIGTFVYYTKFKRPVWLYPILGILFSFLIILLYRLIY